VGEALPQVQQDRPDTLDIRYLTTGHDRQAAGLGPRRPARYRCIDPAHAGGARQFRGHVPGSGGFEAGKVHQQLPGLRAPRHAFGTEHHLAHHLGIGQTQHHHIRCRAELRRCGHLPRPRLDQRRALFRVTVPHGQWITGGQQAPAHRQPHQTDAGKCQGR